VTWFRKTHHGLESLEQRLRDDRPEPSTELFYRVTAEIRRHDAPEPVRTPIRARAAFAVALTAALLVVAAAAGGMSYAASGARHTASAISHVFVPTSSHNLQGDNKPNGDERIGDLFNKGDDHGAAHWVYPQFVLVCLAVPPQNPFIHITLNVPQIAADSLMAQRLAVLGACGRR
jgi:hypothetical protein